MRHRLIDVQQPAQLALLLLPTAIIQQVIAQGQGEQQHDYHPHASQLLRGASLQLAEVAFQRMVFAKQLVQRGVNHVVIVILVQPIQRQASHRCLVAYIQNNVEVGVVGAFPPSKFGGLLGAHELHVARRLVGIGFVVFVQALQGRIYIRQCLFVFAIDVGIIGIVGIVGSHVEQRLVLGRPRLFGLFLYGGFRSACL